MFGVFDKQIDSLLGVRYSTSLLLVAITANRLARRALAKTTDGRREAAPLCFVDEGGVVLSDLRYLLVTTSSNERLVILIGTTIETSIANDAFVDSPIDCTALLCSAA